MSMGLVRPTILPNELNWRNKRSELRFTSGMNLKLLFIQPLKNRIDMSYFVNSELSVALIVSELAVTGKRQDVLVRLLVTKT
jgi:hypothetical protein